MKKYFLFFWFAPFFSVLGAQAVTWKPWFTIDTAEGRTWSVDTTAVIPNASVPGFNITNDSMGVLGFAPGRGAATSSDSGRTFMVQNTWTTPLRIDGGFVYLPDGRTRFVCEAPGPTNTPSHHRSVILSWISNDGKNWAQEAGIRYQPGVPDDSICGVPDILQVNDSVWRMYYVGDWYGANGIRTAISNDWGWTWTPESVVNILPRNYVDPDAVYLDNGSIRLYTKTPPVPGTGIGYCDGDGLHFDTTSVPVVIPGFQPGAEGKYDPCIVKFPGGGLVCYMGSQSDSMAGPPKIIGAWATDSNTLAGVNGLLQETVSCVVFPDPVTTGSKLVVFSDRERGEGELEIFDATGRLAAEKNNFRIARGRNETALPELQVAGIYFYRVTAGNEIIGKGKIIAPRLQE